MREVRLLKDGVSQLRSTLPQTWTVSLEAARPHPANDGVDAELTIAADTGSGRHLAVVVKARAEPRDVPTLADIRHLTGRELLLIAPWLSARTRDRLDANQVHYLDLTGNCHLTLDRPTLYLRTAGAAHNPSPPPHSEVSLRSAAAARLTRLLIDVTPPYTPTELANGLSPSEQTAGVLARHSGVSLPHVSRLLTQLDRDALIERGTRGRVTHVDWPGLLRARAESYDLLATNTARGYIAPRGARDALRRLAAVPRHPYRAITAAFAAETLHQTAAAPTQLIAYVDDPDDTAEALDLLPADENPDVLLLTDFDYSTVDRTVDRSSGVTTVATSQIALDCLAGNGRLPAEGDALLDWMTQHEPEWRRTRLSDLGPRAPVYP